MGAIQRVWRRVRRVRVLLLPALTATSLAAPTASLEAERARPCPRGHHRRRHHRLQRGLPPGARGLERSRAARQGPAHERIDLPRRRPRHAVQPVAHDDALPPLQHRAVPRARGVRDGRQRAHRVQPRVAGRAAARRLARTGDRPRGRAGIARRDAATAAAGQPGVALRLGLPAGRRQSRPAFGDLRAGGRGARPGRRDPHGRARDGHRARLQARGARGAHGVGAHRDRGRRQRRRHVGAAGRGHGRRPPRLDPRGASAHRARGRARSRAAARPALLPRSRLPRLRQVGGGRGAVRRLRARPGGALAGRRAVGAQRPERSGRRGALRTAHAGRRASASRSSPTPASSSSSAIPTP